MSSILAFSATHMAWLTQSVETNNLAHYHRDIARKGLIDAIGNFSQANSDAVLAASILLSWQASDWWVTPCSLGITRAKSRLQGKLDVVDARNLDGKYTIQSPVRVGSFHLGHRFHGLVEALVSLQIIHR